MLPILYGVMAAELNIIYSLSNLPSSIVDIGAPTQTYFVDITFRTAGDIDILKNFLSDNLNVEQYVDPGFQSTNTYVRCTYVSGSHMTSGSAEDTWHQCSVERDFKLLYTSSGGDDSISGTFNFELSDDGGTTIVATKNAVTVQVGELF